jgi:phage terminase large subunit
MQSIAKFPKALQFLFVPSRYKVAHGGRGSSKSWSVARALLIQGVDNKLRILCTREVQKSIKDSVYKLLCDQIEDLKLGQFYSITETSIKGVNGTEFTFAGLASHTVESIKSFEGVDRCWIEEGQTVCAKSWDILIPTIRKDGSEIWITMNPMLDTDETYVRFVVDPPPNSIVRQVNYTDNPWFPEVLEAERAHCEATRPEDYKNIWLGQCLSAVAGAIYAEEVKDIQLEQRVCNLPYDPKLKVHTIWDLGWNDSMSIILCQKVRSEIRIIEYIEDSHKTLDYYASLLNAKNMNWGYDYLPHDGRTKDFKTGRSAEEILKSFGRKVKITPNIGIEPGIKMARSMLKQCYFDKTKTARLLECLKRYRRSINSQTNEPGAPLHDEHSHGADSIRYLAVNVDSLSNEERRPNEYVRPVGYDPGAGY